MQLVSFNFIFGLLGALSNNSSLQFHTVEGLCQYTASAFTAPPAHGESEPSEGGMLCEITSFATQGK